jgi:hypothetical protein
MSNLLPATINRGINVRNASHPYLPSSVNGMSITHGPPHAVGSGVKGLLHGTGMHGGMTSMHTAGTTDGNDPVSNPRKLVNNKILLQLQHMTTGDLGDMELHWQDLRFDPSGNDFSSDGENELRVIRSLSALNGRFHTTEFKDEYNSKVDRRWFMNRFRKAGVVRHINDDKIFNGAGTQGAQDLVLNYTGETQMYDIFQTYKPAKGPENGPNRGDYLWVTLKMHTEPNPMQLLRHAGAAGATSDYTDQMDAPRSRPLDSYWMLVPTFSFFHEVPSVATSTTFVGDKKVTGGSELVGTLHQLYNVNQGANVPAIDFVYNRHTHAGYRANRQQMQRIDVILS